MSDRAFVFLAIALGIAVFLLVCWLIQGIGVAAFGPEVPAQLVSSCSVP